MNKEVVKILISVSIILFTLSFVSAGFSDWFNSITGKATQPVNLNITVGGPIITNVYNNTMTSVLSGPDEGPSSTTIIVNFTAFTTAGNGNLNHSAAKLNISGDSLRYNNSCQNTANFGNYANYSCTLYMWWFDGSGTWNITAFIQDNQTNVAQNTTTKFFVGQRTSFVMSPSALTWPGISPGSQNQTSNNDPILLNNTGNANIAAGSITVNSSNLRGEITTTEALWANNFSFSWDTGGNNVECAGSVMQRAVYTGIAIANLTKGNYTTGDGNIGQENLYICLRRAGSELSTQSYSTANETEWPWVIQIT